MTDDKPTFCLLMIVRDETKVIRRALDSVSAFLRGGRGSLYIHDTGSHDETPAVIESWCADKNVFGIVDHRIWRNFGENKTDLIQSAQSHTDHRISGVQYYIWLDADEVWIKNLEDPLSYPEVQDVETIQADWDNHAEANIFMLMTKSGQIYYQRWNACRNNQPYRWHQPVHEYFEGERSNVRLYVESVGVLARQQGNSSQSPRYRRDAQMFLEFLQENPNEPRAQFYLAQSYENFNQDLARKWYEIRANNQTGYSEEHYIACLRLGRMHPDVAQATSWLMRAVQINPDRMEAWYSLMINAHNAGNHRSAVGFGYQAPINRTPNRHWLFVEQDKYSWMFDLNIALSCERIGLWHLAIDYTEPLLTRAGVPPQIQEIAKRNLNYFKNKMPAALALAPAPAPAPGLVTPMQKIIVIDDFYPDPGAIRQRALSAEYPISGNYPGKRSLPWLDDGIKERFERIIGRPITYWPETYNGAFQWVTEKDKSWIHRDKTDWSVVVYLTPDAPIDGGTKLYIHKETRWSIADTDEKDNRLNQDSRNEEAWHIVDRIGNLYNRAVLFRGRNSHMSDRYFGTDLNTGRLFQTFFFNDS